MHLLQTSFSTEVKKKILWTLKCHMYYFFEFFEVNICKISLRIWYRYLLIILVKYQGQLPLGPMAAFHPFLLYPTDMKEIPSRYQLLTTNDSFCMLQHALTMCMLSITHTSPFELQCSTLLSLSPAHTQLSKLHCIQLWLNQPQPMRARVIADETSLYHSL
jgi:hypothetical protein